MNINHIGGLSVQHFRRDLVKVGEGTLNVAGWMKVRAVEISASKGSQRSEPSRSWSSRLT